MSMVGESGGREWPKAGLVGFGEYVLPGFTDIKVSRERFFEAMRKVARPALDELHAIIPIYRPLEDRLCYNPYAGRSGDWASWGPWLRLAHDDPEVAELVNRLDTWAVKYHLTAAWLRDSAVRNLVGWSQIQRCAENREWLYPGSTILVGDGRFSVTGVGMPEARFDFRRFAPEVPAPNPFAETKQQYMDRVRRIAEEAWGKATAAAEELGGRRALGKRNRGGGRLQHFEWLVLYHVIGMTYEDVADRYSRTTNKEHWVDTDTVRKAVKDTARLVGLRLRD